jgi:hypothetical protein
VRQADRSEEERERMRAYWRAAGAKKRAKPGYREWFNSVRAKWAKEKYASDPEHRERVKATSEQRRLRKSAELRPVITAAKAGGCYYCPESESICLDFHHRDPSEKSFRMGTAVALGYSVSRIREEIDKCVVMCSNCHRKLHAGLLPPPQ